MFDMLKIKLIETLRSFQHACLTPVMRDDDGDNGDALCEFVLRG